MSIVERARWVTWIVLGDIILPAIDRLAAIRDVYAEPHVPKDIEFGIYLNGRASRNEKGEKEQDREVPLVLELSDDGDNVGCIPS